MFIDYVARSTVTSFNSDDNLIVLVSFLMHCESVYDQVSVIIHKVYDHR